MNDFSQRQRDIRRLVAKRACEQPLLPSGLWFHGDIRDNFYYASYLYAAASEGEARLSQVSVGTFLGDDGSCEKEPRLCHWLRLLQVSSGNLPDVCGAAGSCLANACLTAFHIFGRCPTNRFRSRTVRSESRRTLPKSHPRSDAGNAACS